MDTNEGKLVVDTEIEVNGTILMQWDCEQYRFY